MIKPSVRLSVLAAIDKIGPLAAPLGHDIAPGSSVKVIAMLGGSRDGMHRNNLTDELVD